MRPKPEHFDLIADKLRDRVDVWATRGTAAKVYLVQDDDELVFSLIFCLLYTSPSPRDMRRSRMPSSA